MNILFISEYLPYFPCYDGFRLIPYNILKELSKRHNFHLISFINDARELKYKEQIGEFCSSVETVFYSHQHTMLKKLKNVFSRYTWESEMYDRIQTAIKKHNIDLIYVEGANIAQYVQKIESIPKIVFPHDSPSARAFSLLKLNNTLIKRMKIFIDWLKAVSYEKTVYRHFDHCVVVGPIDKKVIQKHCPNLKVSAISNGVDSKYYAYKPAETGNHKIIFTGNMSYAPNADAVLYFCDNILPLVKKQYSDIKFYIVGSSPSRAVTDLQVDSSIVVTGQVSDIRHYIYESSVCVCPMRQGTGIKNKILEAMAMGIPIVATKTSTVGINITNGENILVEDNPVDFASKVSELLNGRDKRLKLAKNGRRLIDNEYRWDRKAIMVEQILSNVKENFKNR